MAICGSSSRNIVLLAAAGGFIQLVLLAVVVHGASVCPGNFVYPFSAHCFSPARYYGQEVYELTAYNSVLGLSLAPEWDETNSTYYVRLAEVGAKYMFIHWPTKEYRFAVSQSDDVRIVNVETGRILGWRQEGKGEYFLVESEIDSSDSAFQFALYDGPVACILPYPPVSCGVYNLLNFGALDSLGLSPYVEDNVTYFQLSKAALAAFILRRTSPTTTTTTATSTSSIDPIIQMATTAATAN